MEICPRPLTRPLTLIENVEFPTFDASKATDQFRAFAEKGVEQSKEAYAKLKTGAEERPEGPRVHLRDRQVRFGSDLSLKTIAAHARQRRSRLLASRSSASAPSRCRKSSSCRPPSCASASR